MEPCADWMFARTSRISCVSVPFLRVPLLQHIDPPPSFLSNFCVCPNPTHRSAAPSRTSCSGSCSPSGSSRWAIQPQHLPPREPHPPGSSRQQSPAAAAPRPSAAALGRKRPARAAPATLCCCCATSTRPSAPRLGSLQRRPEACMSARAHSGSFYLPHLPPEPLG